MHEPFEIPEPLNELEQQLRLIQPRAPRLDWNELNVLEPTADSVAQATNASSNATTIAANSPIITSTSSISARNMWLALAASWIFGAVVGGSAIFWALNTQSNRIAQQVTEDQPSEKPGSPDDEPPTPTTVATNPTIAIADRLRSDTNSLQSYQDYAVVVDFNLSKWSSDQPLSVRKLSQRKAPTYVTSLGPGFASNESSSNNRLDQVEREDRATSSRSYLQEVLKQIQ